MLSDLTFRAFAANEVVASRADKSQYGIFFLPSIADTYGGIRGQGGTHGDPRNVTGFSFAISGVPAVEAHGPH